MRSNGLVTVLATIPAMPPQSIRRLTSDKPKVLLLLLLLLGGGIFGGVLLLLMALLFWRDRQLKPKVLPGLL